MSSPLLTADGKAYQWPPLPAKPEKVFQRATHLLGLGVPQFWMKPWVAKLISEHVADNWYQIGQFFAQGGDRETGVRILKGLPDQVRDTAAVRGTDIHHWLERISLQEKVEPPEHLLAHLDQGIDFLHTVNPDFILTEGTVFNETFGYAGSFDAILRITRNEATASFFTNEFALRDELYVLLDYKTGDKGAKDTYALQLALYKNAEFLALQDQHGWYKSELPPIDICCVLEVNADKWRLLEMRTDDEVWECAKHVAGVAKWTSDVSRTVMNHTRVLSKIAADVPPTSVSEAEAPTPLAASANPFYDRVVAHATVLGFTEFDLVEWFGADLQINSEDEARAAIRAVNAEAKRARQLA